MIGKSASAESGVTTWHRISAAQAPNLSEPDWLRYSVVLPPTPASISPHRSAARFAHVAAAAWKKVTFLFHISDFSRGVSPPPSRAARRTASALTCDGTDRDRFCAGSDISFPLRRAFHSQ